MDRCKRLVNNRRSGGELMVVTAGFAVKPEPGRSLISSCGEQLAQPGDAVRGNARQHIVEPRERLDAAPLAGSDETAKHGRRFAAAVALYSYPVVYSQMPLLRFQQSRGEGLDTRAVLY